MIYDRVYFDKGIDRRNTQCEKWDDRAVMPEGAIPLWVADMDFACAQPIVDAIRQRAEHPCYGYNLNDPRDEEAVIGYWQRRHGLAIHPGQTLMLPCVVTGLRACVRAFSTPGERVAIFTPVYGPFYSAIEENGRQAARIPLLREEQSGRYLMDLKALKAELENGVRLVMLCNPHNPVSRLWSRQELTDLCRLVAQYGAKLVCDEIHADFVYAPGVFTPALSLPEARDCAVMLCSASKTFNVAGLEQATAVSFSPALLSAVAQKTRAAGAACGNTFALCATQAAYTQCDDWLDGLLQYLDENRGLLADLVKEYLPKAILTPVEATYLAWLDLRPYGKTCDELEAAFLKHGVALTGGLFFGQEGQGFMRVNFGCPQAMLREGIKRMGDALREE